MNSANNPREPESKTCPSKSSRLEYSPTNTLIFHFVASLAENPATPCQTSDPQNCWANESVVLSCLVDGNLLQRTRKQIYSISVRVDQVKKLSWNCKSIKISHSSLAVMLVSSAHNLLTRTSRPSLPNIEETEKCESLILENNTHLNHDCLSLLSFLIPLLLDFGRFHQNHLKSTSFQRVSHLWDESSPQA